MSNENGKIDGGQLISDSALDALSRSTEDKELYADIHADSVQDFIDEAQILPVVARVCRWNQQRYEQEWDSPLASSLLTEEFVETLLADDLVDILDGIGDSLFVAIGCFWKQRMLNDDGAVLLLETVIQREDFNLLNAYFEHHLHSWPSRGLEAAFYTFKVCFEAIKLLNLGDNKCKYADVDSSSADVTLDCHSILLAITKSNETKSIKKTASNVKANLDKGRDFVGPQQDLEILIKGGKV